MDRNHSFSIKPADKQAKDTVKATKQYCKDNGVSFSFVIVSGLRMFLEAKNVKA